MRGWGLRSFRTTLLAGLSILALAGCGDEEQSFGDARIVDALGLERTDDGYSVGGDPFCMLSERFFGTSAEVEAAKADKDAGIVISSRSGDVAVEAVPPFAPDCKRQARKRLDRLDPPDEE